MTDAAVDPIKAENRKITKRLATVLFNQKWAQENPEGSEEERKAAFKDAREENLKVARNLRTRLKRNGISLSLDEEKVEVPA